MQNCLFSGNRAIGGTGSNAAAVPTTRWRRRARAGRRALHLPEQRQFGHAPGLHLREQLRQRRHGRQRHGHRHARARRPWPGRRRFRRAKYFARRARCTFKNNDAIGGNCGAGSNAASTNTAEGQGGAIYVIGFAVITGCTLDDNEASGGNGIPGTALIGAAGQGGGLFYNFGAVNVTEPP